MPKPTNTEMIHDLLRAVAVLGERLESTREELRELKRKLEEDSKSRWALLPPVFGAIVNVLLSAIVA